MTRRKHNIRRGDAGFTLLELIATLAVIALAFGFVMPRLSGSRQSLALRAAATDIAAQMELARSEATSRNVDAIFVLDITKRTFAGATQGKPRVLPREIAARFETTEAALSSSGLGVFRFRPDRTASGGRILLSAGRDKVEIDVDWLTGAVNVRWIS